MKQNNNMPKKVPYNIEVEQSVLGCILLSDTVAGDLCSTLNSNDFYSPVHKTIFETMQGIFKKNQPIDLVTLVSTLEKDKKLNEIGGINYITTLTNTVPTANNYEHYVQILTENSKLRKLLELGQNVTANAFDCIESSQIIECLEKQLTDIISNRNNAGLRHLTGPLENVIENFQDIVQNPTATKNLKTDFYGLDKILNGGLHKGDLILLAARPGVGKTTLAMNIVTNTAIKQKATVAIFSLEMPKEQLAQRALCSVAKVDMSKALSGKLDQEDWRALWESRKLLLDSQIYVDDSSLSNAGIILSECRELKREKGLDLVMIDYLQLMNSAGKNTENRQQEISAITRSLKIAAKELDVPILLLSQLSRATEQRVDHRPMLADLRESGSIEQDADIVMFIYNPDVYKSEEESKPGIVDLMIAKHRNGSQGTVKLIFRKEFTTFTNSSFDAENGSLEVTMPSLEQSHVPPNIIPLDESDITNDIFKE